MSKTYLNLIPEQIDALWSVADGLFPQGAPLDLARFLENHPDYELYGGDRPIEDAEDQTLMKILDQLHAGLSSGNVELDAHLRAGLDEILEDQCRGTRYYGNHPYFRDPTLIITEDTQ